MDKLASIQAYVPPDTADSECDDITFGSRETFAALGCEPLEGSGFEHEQPEAGFEEEEVS